jgi:hypothetical protein
MLSIGLWRWYINITITILDMSWVELMLWQTVSRPIRLGFGQPFGAYDQIFLFLFFCRTIAFLFVLGRPLWREDGSIICSAIYQWSESRRTHNHTLLFHLRLLGSLSVASYDSQGLRWEYSNPPPHRETTILDIIHRPLFYLNFGDYCVSVFKRNLLKWAQCIELYDG